VTGVGSTGGGVTGGRDAFSQLGVDPGDQLTDDEVRAAWRRIAAATHPDRADGGDPERFAAAAAAYTELRTSYGRNEARAALAELRPASSTAGVWRRVTGSRPARPASSTAGVWRRITGSRPARPASSTAGVWRRITGSRPTPPAPSNAGVRPRIADGRPTRPASSTAGVWRRVSAGRPARLALRLGIAAVAATLGLLAAGGGPAGPALAVGAATWLVLTARQDLGPR